MANSRAVRLRLVIPGLPWPGADRETVHAQARVPTLARWLARGERRRETWTSTSTCLMRALGGDGDTESGHAAISLLGEGLDPGTLHWLRADPVAFHVGRTGLALAAPRLADLTLAEAQALAETVREHFGTAMPRLELAHPQRWYLGLPAAPAIETIDPEAAAGRDVALGMPRGEQRARWLAFVNEVQMLWHDHPVNRDREARGALPVASLWLHAAADALPHPPHVPWRRSCGPSPLLTGLARAGGGEHRDASDPSLDWLLRAPADEACLLDTTVLDALWRVDAQDWLRAIEALDAGPLAAADRALAAGHVREILLCLPGPDAGLAIGVTRLARLRLWRRPCGLRLDA